MLRMPRKRPPPLPALDLPEALLPLVKQVRPTGRRWGLMTTRGALLLFLQAYPNSTMPQAAGALGISTRRVNQLVGELRTAGVLKVTKTGGRNSYEVRLEDGT
jgi:hypothetical protein